MNMASLRDVLSQQTTTERIYAPESERFLTIKLRGGGIVERIIREGKAPQKFTGYRVRAGQFIYSRIDARNGAFGMIPEHFDGAVVSKDFPVFNLDRTRVDEGYWQAFICTPELANVVQRKLSFGATNRQRVSEDAFLSLKIPLPDMAEQRRIAEILDKADATRTNRRETIAHLDALRQSIFHKMFTDVTISRTVQLAAAVHPNSIVTYGIVQAGEEVSDGVPYIRTGDLKGGYIDMSGLRRTAPEIAAKFTRSRVSRGDIVMSIRATVGTVALVPSELEGANLTQGTARIAPGPEILAPYLLEYLRSDNVQNWIKRQVKGATFREITLDRLRKLPVNIPPLELQQEFVDCMAAAESLRTEYLAQLAELDDLFFSLQHRAFKGKL